MGFSSSPARAIGVLCLPALLCTIAGGSFTPRAFGEEGVARGALNRVLDGQGMEVLFYEESHALVIGISDYTNGWPDLPGVRKDVEEVRAALESQGFDVAVKLDLGSDAFDRAFDDFIGTYGHAPESRLLIYYAGHGHTVRTTYGEELGYIVPADAPLPARDLPNFQRTAMEMQQIEIFAKRIQSKHALFLFDACFSGSLFALSRAVPEVISYKTSNPVRQFITSGSADEAVPDRSIFRSQFARALEGEGDRDGDGYLTGTELGEFLQTTVINYSYNMQHPQYGKIRNPNLDKGDFVFVMRSRGKEGKEEAGRPPPRIDSTFDDLALRANWQAYLSRMEEDFAKVEAFGKQDYPASAKSGAWKRFTDTYAEDDPFSEKDESLRAQAVERARELEPLAAGSKVDPMQRDKDLFRIDGVTVKNAAGKVLTPKGDIYTIGAGETLTIFVDVSIPEGHSVTATWTARNGRVLATSRMVNAYTAGKPGPDVVVVYLLDESNGDEMEESVIMTVTK